MMWRISPALLALVLLGAMVGAEAQEKLRKNETYCLQSAGGANDGPPPLLCNFETREQCLASKTTNGDWCMLNPALGFQKPSPGR
jgi:Protein of unknown function (DUF3551)